MEGQSALAYIDGWIARLADRQHGVVAWFQLKAAGITRGAVDFRLARGRLHIVHRGVYAVGHQVLTQEGRRMAAVLAHGPSAALSHRSAAEHWGMLPPSYSEVVHVTVPGRSTRKTRSGIALHRVPAVEAAVHDGIPITTVSWTLLDLASAADSRLLDRAIEGAEKARLLNLDDLERFLELGRPGVRTLREALADYDDAPTRSELERRFLELCADHGLPRPLVNQWILGRFEVDFLWPAERLVVETDGMAWHASTAAVERDHRRDAELRLAGYEVQRFTWRMVTTEGETVARLIRKLLAERQP
jgi:very-short-patch-repair endonuclease/predicted transcriptional regulator of viral defense system